MAETTWDVPRDKWREDGDFFHRFFPVNARVRKATALVKDEFYYKPRKTMEKGSKLRAVKEEASKPRWIGIGTGPKSVASLYTPLNNLLNAILKHFGLLDDATNMRLFIKTYRSRVFPDSEPPVWPGILLAGGGSSFLSATGPRPIPHYGSAISPLEVVIDESNLDLARYRLGHITQQMFSGQSNRRFAFGLLISQHNVRCYLFDHSGVVGSPALDYHDQPDQFCGLISGLASLQSEHIGFDTSMFFDENGRRSIRTRESSGKGAAPNTKYLIHGLMYHAPRLLGRGTTCYLAHREGDQNTHYVIKDAWISTGEPDLEGRDSEASLLMHAKRLGVERGVAQICHAEEVRLKARNGRIMVDSVLNNRRSISSEPSLGIYRIHTRIVMSTYGKCLDMFSTRQEFLWAYHDAVQAHRNLYDVAGILHRDIKPENILIKPEGAEGDRGVLIDFDHAIRTDNTSPYASKEKIGTYMFMAINALDADRPHGYMDDLESFYYVLLYIILLFTGPNSRRKSIPDFVQTWRGSSAAGMKLGFLSMKGIPIKIQVATWFGSPFERLAVRIHDLFHARIMALGRSWPKPLEEDTAAAAAEFLSHIRQTIAEVEQEESNTHSEVPRPPNPSSTRSSSYASTNNTGDTETHSLPKYGKKIAQYAGPQTLASTRTKRSTANYNHHYRGEKVVGRQTIQKIQKHK